MRENGQKTEGQAQTARLWVGTSGYSYAEWITAGFYPPDTRSAGMLALYAARFAVAELNYTWYQMPKAPAIARMSAAAPGGFLFSAKLNRALTHEVEPCLWRGQAALFREGVGPLVQAGQLAAVLAQFGPGFHRTPENRRYLSHLLDELSGLPLAVEFRHASWASDRVFSGLAARKVALVSVDAPQLPGLFPCLDVVTNSDLFYVRFHGRNARGWRSGNMQTQFDYDYSDQELFERAQNRIGPMARQAKKGLIFFNNHVRAQAPKNAAQLIAQLIALGLAQG